MPAGQTIRVDGYVRVSRVGDRGGERFISPVVQREQIEAWAESRHATLLRVFEELDESGARADRPLLAEAVRRVEEGVSDGVVVSKVNRFGRSLIDGLLCIERIRRAGGRFYSVIDGLDTGTPAGRLVLRIMLSMAEWDLDRIRTEWAIARERSIRRGVSVLRSVPVGYRKTRSGRLKPDPRTAPVMAEVFRRRAAGESVSSLCRYLEARGVETGHGNSYWCPGSLAHSLRCRVYLGELRLLDIVNEHAHEPLIDPGTWERAQTPRQLPHYANVEPLLLSGLARCAACSMTLAVRRGSPGDPGYRMYQCRRRFARGVCPAPAYVMAPGLEQYVTDAFFKLVARRRRPPLAELDAAQRRLAAQAAQLASYRDNDRLRAILGDDQFAAGLTTRSERVRDARIALSNVQTRIETHDLPTLPELRRTWPSLDVLEQRALLARVIDCVFVARGHRHLERRVTICPIGTAPSGLSRQGAPGTPLRAVKPRRGWINPTTD